VDGPLATVDEGLCRVYEPLPRVDGDCARVDEPLPRVDGGSTTRMATLHVWMLSVHAEMTSLLVRMETGNVRMPIEQAWMT
jgi:hypothetical protein